MLLFIVYLFLTARRKSLHQPCAHAPRLTRKPTPPAIPATAGFELEFLRVTKADRPEEIKRACRHKIACRLMGNWVAYYNRGEPDCSKRRKPEKVIHPAL